MKFKYTKVDGVPTAYGVTSSRMTAEDNSVVKQCYTNIEEVTRNENKSRRAQAAFNNYQLHMEEYPGFDRGPSTFLRLHDGVRFELRAEHKERIAQGLRQQNETITTEYNERVHIMEQELTRLRLIEDAAPQIEELQGQLDTIREEFARTMRQKDADLENVVAEARQLKDKAAREKATYQAEIESHREQARMANAYNNTLESNLQVVLDVAQKQQLEHMEKYVQQQAQMQVQLMNFNQNAKAVMRCGRGLTHDDVTRLCNLPPDDFAQLLMQDTEPVQKRLREA